MRELDDVTHVDHRAVSVTHVRDRDEERVLVDRGIEVLERKRSICRFLDVRHARAACFLRMPDLADRRKLPVGQHDLRAAREPQSALQRGDASRQRRRDGDLFRNGVDQIRKACARRFLPFDPVLPRRTFLVPVAEVLLVRVADRIG